MELVMPSRLQYYYQVHYSPQQGEQILLYVAMQYTRMKDKCKVEFQDTF